MADAVATVQNGDVVRLTNLCDGTGESAVVKVDKSATKASAGRLGIEKIDVNIYGFTYVDLLFDHTADDLAVRLVPGHYSCDYSALGGIVDPESAGGTGDIVLTTAGNTANDYYDIILWLRYYN